MSTPFPFPSVPATLPVYLDHNASTPLLPPVSSSMLPFLQSPYTFGNPSSSHFYGKFAKAAVEKARHQVGKMIGCEAGSVLFLSGGSEANNLVLKSTCQWLWKNQSESEGFRESVSESEPLDEKKVEVVISAVEHPSVMIPEDCLGEHVRVRVIPVDEFGRIRLDVLENSDILNPRTAIVSIMHANNEVGTIQPIAEVAEIVKKKNAELGREDFPILFHCDAAQSIGKIPVKVSEMGVDFLSVCGHKFNAPKGVGALYIRPGLEKVVRGGRLVHGASHEGGLRAGTENVILVVGLGAAAEMVEETLDARARNMAECRDLLLSGISGGLSSVDQEIKVNGHPEFRIPNTLSVSFSGIQANQILEGFGDRVSASAGAACHSDHVSISKVLKAMNVPERVAMGTIRLSVGANTTRDEIDRAVEVIVEVVKSLIPS